MNRGRKLSEKSLLVLSSLYRVGTMVADDFLNGKMGEAYSRKLQYGMAKRLYNLADRGYVTKVVDKNNQSFFHLTPKGKLSILKFLHLEKLKLIKWDGNFRVIIFDIPERLRKSRGYLRKELKRLGFHPIQESVYITPYPVTGELDQLLKEWGMRKYFRYLTVSEIDGEGKLKLIFGLQ